MASMSREISGQLSFFVQVGKMHEHVKFALLRLHLQKEVLQKKNTWASFFTACYWKLLLFFGLKLLHLW
jgi:hypothetical protein